MATTKTHMLCWTADSDQVAVVPWPDTTGQSDAFDCTALACNEAIRAEEVLEKRQLHIHTTAMYAMVCDQVDPQALHIALCEFDEYRAGLIEGMPVPDKFRRPV